MYTVREAAWLLQQSESKVRRWLFASGDAALLQGFREGKFRGIDFQALVEALVVGQLRDAGFSMPAIRKARATLVASTGADHPFARQRLLTDCKSLELYWLDDDENLTNLRSKQLAFVEVMRPYLAALEFDPSGNAVRWNIAAGIIVDPRYVWGAPIIDGTRISAQLVANMLRDCNGDVDQVAEWYGITPLQVQAAAEFVRRLDQGPRGRTVRQAA